MPPVLNPHWPRGPTNRLHDAARSGSVRQTVALLARGSINIDLGDPEGCTPLFIAALEDHPTVVDVLLKGGASVAIANNANCTPLHVAALRGHIGITHMLLRAGSEPNAANVDGQRPLHMAAGDGHSPVTRMLLRAGADPDACDIKGHAALYPAAFGGHLSVCRDLLDANAKPGRVRAGSSLVPLDVAAQNGHSAVMHELLKLGVEACSSGGGGVEALCLAAKHERVEAMLILRKAGVVDTGEALINAVTVGSSTSAKFLLHQHQQPPDYVNFHKEMGLTPIISGAYSASPRIVRMLLDHGADESLVVLAPNQAGGAFESSAMDLVVRNLEWKELQGVTATEEQLYRLESIRRLLLQAEAVRAVSWVWPGRNTGRVTHCEKLGPRKSAATPLETKWPTTRSCYLLPGRVLMATLVRWVALQ
ncbi:unnamed protein product [Scytosiphon promiscuus]